MMQSVSSLPALDGGGNGNHTLDGNGFIYPTYHDFTATDSPTSSPTTLNNNMTTTNMDDDNNYQTNTLLLIFPRVTALISLFAIVCVAVEAWYDMVDDRQSSLGTLRGNRIRSGTSASRNLSTITRIQLYYQIPLFCFALAFALGTTPAPQDALWGSDFIWGAVGTTATCSLQGFLAQFGCMGMIGWDGVLSLTYFMMVRYKVTNFRLGNWEKYYHVMIWPFCAAMTIYPLIHGMYNFTNTICWLDSYPNGCEGEECIRGAGGPTWQNIASLLTMLHLVYSITIMICLYCSIRGLENRHRRYTASSSSAVSSRDNSGDDMMQDNSCTTNNTVTTTNSNRRRKNSRAVGMQGIWYASGMVVTGLPTPLAIILWNMFGIWSIGFGILATSLLPLVGYVNFVIFMRGRKVENCQTRYGKFLRRLHSCVFDYHWHCCCCCCCSRLVCRFASKEDSSEDVEDSATKPMTHPKGGASSGNRPRQQQERRPSTLPPIQEGRAPVEDSEQAVIDWPGWFISLTRKSASKLVSDLGASIGSLESELCSSQDGPPSQPFRHKSQVERPPSIPMRVVSELDDSSNHNHNSMEISHRTEFHDEYDSCTGRSRDSEPHKPMRYVSEVEQPLPIIDTTTTTPSRRNSTSSSQAPIKPVRYVSEIETTQPEYTRSSSKPTLLSDIEAPLEEEEDCSTTCRDESDSVSGAFWRPKSSAVTPKDKPASFVASKRSSVPPMKPERYVSEVEDAVASSGRPMRPPQRYVSEVENKVPDLVTKKSMFSRSSENNNNNNNVRAPPVKPERFVSEVE